ncbi:hypothetical protein [Micromonospora carbonacea]|uniref:hypothetical protein n=1 Tax=Micromonospora carbonacea TaxID=47853 RepID=UPI001792F6DE|nr:hypothetical protein [Micromonospora carbonacea]MBB5827147.1 hypothetical protein [Micromonospora carbonacea]
MVDRIHCACGAGAATAGTRVTAWSTTASWRAPSAVATAYRARLLVPPASRVSRHSWSALAGSVVRMTAPEATPPAGARERPLCTPVRR